MAASAIWQPQEDGLREICGLLGQHISPSSDKPRIWQQLQHYSQFPDFNNYLAFILARAEGTPIEIRQAAGLLLKNNLRSAFKSMVPSNQQYIKSELLPCLGAADKHIRSTVGTIISVIVQQGKISGWPELLQALVQCLESNDLNHMDGAMDSLSKIKLIEKIIALEACVQARNEGRDFARECNEIIHDACKWRPELAAACEVWKEIKFEFEAMDNLLLTFFLVFQEEQSRFLWKEVINIKIELSNGQKAGTWVRKKIIPEVLYNWDNIILGDQICEDIPQELDSDVPGLAERPINVFIPRLLQLFQSPHASLRKHSLCSINQFIMLMPTALRLSMDQYLQGLFGLAQDSAAEVRKLVSSFSEALQDNWQLHP